MFLESINISYSVNFGVVRVPTQTELDNMPATDVENTKRQKENLGKNNVPLKMTKSDMISPFVPFPDDKSQKNLNIPTPRKRSMTPPLLQPMKKRIHSSDQSQPTIIKSPPLNREAFLHTRIMMENLNQHLMTNKKESPPRNSLLTHTVPSNVEFSNSSKPRGHPPISSASFSSSQFPSYPRQR